MFASYVLQSLDRKRTYIGATVDVDHRLDQHNGVLKGGARATAGRQWERVIYVTGFPTWNDALKFEWRWKHITRTYNYGFGLAGRVRALLHLVGMERASATATPFILWRRHFRLWVKRSRLADLEKIDGTSRLLSGSRALHDNTLSFQSYNFPTFLSEMSLTNISVEQFQQLVSLVEGLKLDVTTLMTRLPAPTNAPVEADGEKKKRGRKPKASVASVASVASAAAVNTIEPTPAPAASEKKKEKKERVKKVCPAGAEGVVRFAGSSDKDKNKYRVFSNLYKSPMTIEGVEYPSVEHYLGYQKYITTDAAYAAEILGQKNPALVTGKARSKEHPSREDWDTVRADFLNTALEVKFQNAELRALLLETGAAAIEFESTVDAYYGIGADGKGTNQLGKALVALRTELAE